MARKENRPPRVPRSSPGAAGGAGSPEVGVTTGPRNISLEEFHHHVKSDLTRIAIFGAVIFAGMIALKVVGF